MYGIIGQLRSTPGNREKLINILLDATTDLPGCRLYAIAADTADDVSIWITEIWESQELHQASLQLPSVQAAVGAGKPLIAGFGNRHIVNPIGGHGVVAKTSDSQAANMETQRLVS